MPLLETAAIPAIIPVFPACETHCRQNRRPATTADGEKV
jgi:hypothetical protein